MIDWTVHRKRQQNIQYLRRTALACSGGAKIDVLKHTDGILQLAL